MLHGRPDAARFHVHGFLEQGTTTTPFDMVVRNEMSRYHLALEAVHRARRTPDGVPELMQHCQEMLERHHTYIVEHFEDLPEVRELDLGVDMTAPEGPPSRVLCVNTGSSSVKAALVERGRIGRAARRDARTCARSRRRGRAGARRPAGRGRDAGRRRPSCGPRRGRLRRAGARRRRGARPAACPRGARAAAPARRDRGDRGGPAPPAVGAAGRVLRHRVPPAAARGGPAAPAPRAVLGRWGPPVRVPRAVLRVRRGPTRPSPRCAFGRRAPRERIEPGRAASTAGPSTRR